VTTSEVPLAGGGSTRVVRHGDVVLRERREWSGTVVRLLQHLRTRGFDFAPRPIGDGFAEDGREALPFVDGRRGADLLVGRSDLRGRVDSAMCS